LTMEVCSQKAMLLSGHYTCAKWIVRIEWFGPAHALVGYNIHELGRRIVRCTSAL